MMQRIHIKPERLTSAVRLPESLSELPAQLIEIRPARAGHDDIKKAEEREIYEIRI